MASAQTTVSVATQKELASAVSSADAGTTISITAAGSYTMPNLPQNITIEGTVDGVEFNHTGSGNVANVPKGATFKNVAFNFGNENYHGFQHAGTINMEGCTLNGKFFSYGDMNFTNCQFVQDNADYHMWAYSGNVTYNNCTFTNTATGKFLNIYNEDGTKKYTVTVNNCKFVNRATSANKAALNVKATCGAKPMNYDVNVNNCTTEGAFPVASTSDNKIVYNSLIQVDDRSTDVKDNLKVTQDGTILYNAGESAIIEISTVDQLKSFRDAVNNKTSYAGKTIKLTADLDLSGEENWEPIGDVAAYPGKAFKGIFDGSGHTISHLTIDDQTVNWGRAALFGSVSNATIKNLTVTDVNIQSHHYAGAIVGYKGDDTNVTISNCHVKNGSIISTPELLSSGSYDNGDKVGAIVGYAANPTTIDGCSAENLNIAGYRDLGSIAGFIAGTVTNCTAKDVTIVQDNKNGYKTDNMLATCGVIVGGRSTNAAATNEANSHENVTIKVAGIGVAAIGDVKYETLADAANAAKSGDTIKLLADLDNTGNVSLPAGVTLDGDGKNITGTSAVYINKDGGTVQNVNFKNIHNETSKLSAIYGGNLAGTATITGCTFDNCDWDAIQITPVAGANVVITNNMFSDDVTDNVKQQRYIHVQSKQNVDFSATITENVMPGKLTQEPIGVYYPTDKAKIDLTKNYIESINDVCILVADNNGYAGELVFPAYTTAEKQETYSPVAMIQNGNYAANFYTTLQAAVDAAEAGATIEILKDFTLTTVTTSPSNKYNVNVNKSVTINGNGHVLTSAEGKRAIVLQGAGNNVVLKDITVKSNNAEACLWIADAVNVTLDNSTLDGTKGKTYNQPLTIGKFDSESRVALNVINGSVIKTNDAGTAHYDIIAWHPAEITVTDSELKGWAAIYFKSAATGSTATVENSTLTSKNPYSGNSNSFGVFSIEATNVTVDVTNSTIDIDGVSNKQAIVNYGTTYGDCTGSMVNLREGNKVTLKNQATFTINQGDTYKLQVSGGLFSEQVPEENCAEGIIPTANTDEATSATYPYTVKEGSYVAQIEGGAKYESLEEAFATAADGSTVKLLTNVALTDRLFINAGSTPAYAGSNNRYATTSENKSITLDLSGNNVTTSSNIALAGGSLNIVNNGTADAEHGVISTTNDGLAPIEIRGTGDLTQKRTLTVGTGVTLSGAEYGLNVFGSNNEQKNVIDVNVNGTVNGTLFVLGNLKNAENEININVAGTVYVPDNGDDEASVGVALNGIATVNVNEGAQVSGETGIEVRAGNLVVNGGNITATASTYSEKKNGSGSCTKGAAVAVAQHTTKLPITATLNGGTLTGTKTLVVTDVEEIGLNDVTVKAADALAKAETVVIPAGYKWVSSEGVSTLTPCDYVAQVGETKYETLADAFAAAAGGNTVTLLKDVALTDRLFINAGSTPAYAGSNNRYATTTENKSITLDLNGNNITSGSNIALAGGSLNIVNTGTADAEHGVISTTNDGLAPIEIRGTGDLTQKRTLTVGTGVTLSGAEYGLNVFGSNNEQKNVIDVNVNGTVNGTLFVLGNLKNTENDVVINVNSGASLKGNVGIALNGFATANVADNTTIEGAELGIEVRAGNLNIAGGTITSTATEYTVKSNGDGSAAKGAAISVAQHTTKLPISTNITGCTLSGVKTISVADPENGNLAGVTVKVADALANAKTVIIPAAYEWVSDGTMSTLTPRDPVAKIGETVYYSLADAVAAVPTDGTEKTITLLADVTENVAVSGGKNIVLDLGEKTLTGYIDLYDSELNVKNGNVAGTVYVNGAAENTEAYNKFTLDATATITKDYGIILWQSDKNTAYGSTIDINGTINGCVFVMGNIKEGNSVINVNDRATIKGEVGIALNGYATLNVVDGATIEGTVDSGIEVRAGKLNVTGGKISSTASKYTVNPNGSGTTTTGAAIAVAQHTTKLATEVTISGGELSGVKTISVADPEGNNLEGVVVTVKDELTEGDVVIPDGYAWVSNKNGTSTLKKKEEAGDFELIHGVPYPCPNGSAVSSVTYRRTFVQNEVGKYRSWFVPFDYTIKESDEENFTFYKIHMIAGSGDTAGGEVSDVNQIYIYLKKANTGDVLYANRPYVVVAKEAKEYIFTADVDKLYPEDHTSRLHEETTWSNYDFYGTYREYGASDKYEWYALNKNNQISPNASANAKLQSYVWAVKVTPRDENINYSKISFVFIDEDNASNGAVTGVSSVSDQGSEIEGIYNLNGAKVDHLNKGINIIKYKDGRIKKVSIK